MVLPGRLPVAALFEHFDQGSTVDEFLEWFPSIRREQVHEVFALLRLSWKIPRPLREDLFDANTPGPLARFLRRA